ISICIKIIAKIEIFFSSRRRHTRSKRDWSSDVCSSDLHLLALKYLQAGGESNIFNLGSSQGFSVKEMIDTARSVTCKDIPAKMGKRRPGDPGTLIASSEKAKRILGWQPQHTSIEIIMRDAWNWHKNNPNGYRKEDDK